MVINSNSPTLEALESVSNTFPSVEVPTEFLPFVTAQSYDSYSDVDHQTWRTLCQQAMPLWQAHAHPDFLKGLEKTGISLDRIPKVTDIDDCLQNYGWRATSVSGFIPPRAFMGLQAYGFLPIAAEIRKPENLTYTPAPDIFHEAAAHAPLLVNEEYGRFLKRFGQLVLQVGFNDEDQQRYDAIRYLSDIKEKPGTPQEEILAAEARLAAVCTGAKETSIGQHLTRLYWWTVEYGLVGDINNPQIYGAGLLSSVGEMQLCLKPEVKKLPLTLDCIYQDFDITKPQPQLYVTESFEQVFALLDEFVAKYLD